MASFEVTTEDRRQLHVIGIEGRNVGAYQHEWFFARPDMRVGCNCLHDFIVPPWISMEPTGVSHRRRIKGNTEGDRIKLKQWKGDDRARKCDTGTSAGKGGIQHGSQKQRECWQDGRDQAYIFVFAKQVYRKGKHPEQYDPRPRMRLEHFTRTSVNLPPPNSPSA